MGKICTHNLVEIGLTELSVSPRGVGLEHWLCNPRVSGLISGAGNLEKLFNWMKIHGLAQKETVTEL